MASQRASITKELLRESLESVLKPFKIHSLDDGKFSCALEFLMCHEVFVNRPTGSGTKLVVSNIRLFSRVHSPRVRCEESVLSGYPERWTCVQHVTIVARAVRNCADKNQFFEYWLMIVVTLWTSYILISPPPLRTSEIDFTPSPSRHRKFPLWGAREG